MARIKWVEINLHKRRKDEKPIKISSGKLGVVTMARGGKPFLTCLSVYKKMYGPRFFKKCVINSEFAQESNRQLLASRTRGYPGGQVFFSEDCLAKMQHINAGILMEHVSGALKEAEEDIRKATEAVGKAFNELIATHKLLAPKILQASNDMRDKRRTLTIEIKQSITLMKDIRKFFLEKDHKIEVERMSEFLGVCERLKALIDDGTMDVISDVILKLEGVKDG